MRIVAILSLGLMLSACSNFYSIAPRGIIKTAGNVSIISTALVMGTGKTVSDHIVSIQTGKDCSTVREEKGRSYCREDEPNPIPALNCYRTLADVVCYAQPDPRNQPGDTIGNL